MKQKQSRFAARTRDNRLRRVALRRGFILRKSGMKDPQATNYNGYMITRADTGLIVLGQGYGASVDDVAEFLGDDG
jgi:hypothetical protein